MDNYYIYSGIAIGLISILTVLFFFGRKYLLLGRKEIRVIRKMIKKDILKHQIELKEEIVALKNFEILDWWEVRILGKESFKKVEVFIVENGKYYEYQAIWNSEVFEKNKATGFNDSPIVNSSVRQSEYVSLSEWEETKSLGV